MVPARLEVRTTEAIIMDALQFGARSFEQLYARVTAVRQIHRDGLESVLHKLKKNKKVMPVDGRWKLYTLPSNNLVTDRREDRGGVMYGW